MSGQREKLWQVFEGRAQEPCLVCVTSGKTISYSELFEKSNNLAARLQSDGVQVQEVVGLCFNNSIEFVCFYLACLQVRAIALPLDPQLRKEELSHYLEVAEVKIVYAHENVPLSQIKLKQALHRVSDSFLDDLAKDLFDMGKWHEEDIFSMTFTSGTTAQPKAIPHRAESLLGNAAAFNQHMNHGEGQVYCHVMPMFYMAGLLNTLLCPLMTGGVIVLGQQFSSTSPLFFWKMVMDHKVTDMWLSPTMAHALVKLDRNKEAPQYAQQHMRSISVGTAPLPDAVLGQFEEKYGVPLLESYGLSELLLVAANQPHRHEGGTVGRLLPDTKVDKADDGELLVTSPYQMVGVNSPRFSTGDLGSINAEGFLVIEGRKKDIIIKGGVNVSPKAVEAKLRQHPDIDDVAVLGREHEFWGEEILAFVIVHEASVLDEKSLKEFSKSIMPQSMIPDQFYFRKQFPRTVTGKVQKNKLLELI